MLLTDQLAYHDFQRFVVTVFLNMANPVKGDQRMEIAIIQLSINIVTAHLRVWMVEDQSIDLYIKIIPNVYTIY